MALLYCQAGCETENVATALGLTTGDPFDNRRDCTYEYPDGRVVHRSPDKKFRQSGNKKGQSLFRADRVTDAETVYVVEGEKNVLAIESVGGVAVCSAMGAGKAKGFDWSVLAGRHLVIVADRDEPGRRHAEDEAQLCKRLAESIAIKKSGVGKDVSDLIAAGTTPNELIDCDTVETEPLFSDIAALLDGTLPEPPKPVVLHRTDGNAIFYRGRHNALIGDPEDGKTWIALAACTETLRNGGKVLFIDLDHNSKEAITANLLMFGAPVKALASQRTFRHCEPEDAMTMINVVAACLPWRPDVMVVDSMGELFATVRRGLQQRRRLHRDRKPNHCAVHQYRRMCDQCRPPGESTRQPCLRSRQHYGQAPHTRRGIGAGEERPSVHTRQGWLRTAVHPQGSARRVAETLPAGKGAGHRNVRDGRA